MLPRYHKIICVSESALNECLEAGISKSRCCLIENAIDTQVFKRTRPLAEVKYQQFAASEDQLVIGSIGRLAEEKGFDLLIKAFERIIEGGINAKLVIAGEGPEEASLRKQISESPANDTIQLLGFVEDTRAFFEGLDIFVLSSYREGLPNVVLEAMAVGASVIATRVGGVERVVEHNTNGLTINPGSVDEIYAALKDLADSAEKRSQLATEARATIENSWSFSKRMDAVVRVYEDTTRA
jgi:glycosyltransferase involved in cell wall biosynthesis